MLTMYRLHSSKIQYNNDISKQTYTGDESCKRQLKTTELNYVVTLSWSMQNHPIVVIVIIVGAQNLG